MVLLRLLKNNTKKLSNNKQKDAKLHPSLYKKNG